MNRLSGSALKARSHRRMTTCCQAGRQLLPTQLPLPSESEGGWPKAPSSGRPCHLYLKARAASNSATMENAR